MRVSIQEQVAGRLLRLSLVALWNSFLLLTTTMTTVTWQTESEKSSCWLPENWVWDHLSGLSLLLCTWTFFLLLVKSWSTLEANIICCQAITIPWWLLGNVRYLFSQAPLHDPILERDLEKRIFFVLFWLG